MSNLAEFRNNYFLQLEYALATGRTVDNLLKRCEGPHGNTQFNSFLQKTASSSSPIDWLDYDDALNASIVGLKHVAQKIADLEAWLDSPYQQILKGLDRKHYNTSLSKIFDCAGNGYWDEVTKGEIKPLLKEFDWWCGYLDSLEIHEEDFNSAQEVFDYLDKPLFRQLKRLVNIVEISSSNWDIDERVFENIVNDLEKNNKDFVPEWLSNAQGLNHYNAKTHREYQSLYSWFFLSICSQAYGYKCNMWATKSQWETLGFELKEEAKPAPVFHYFRVEEDFDNSLDQDQQASFGRKVSIVYNADEVVNYTGENYSNIKVTPLKTLERRIDELAIYIEHGYGEAYYDYAADYIMMPYKETFKAKNATKAYYATILHEMVHWTGHESRCSRKFGQPWDKDYAFEELVAEIGSSFLCARFGLTKKVRSESIAYIKGWKEGLNVKGSMAYLEKAAKFANRASNYIYVPKRDDETEE